MSLSFIVPESEFGKNKVVGGVAGTERDEVVWERIEREQGARGSKVREYKFDMKQVEAFRYRMEDALRAVTRSAIREARVKELKQEILNSDKLKVRSLFASFALGPSSLLARCFVLIPFIFILCRPISRTILWISSSFATTNRSTSPASNHT